MKTALCIALLLALLQAPNVVNAASQHIVPAHSRIARDTRIMNGTLATQGQFPYQASISILNINNTGNDGLCGGVLISETIVASVGHCLIYDNDFDVVLGSLRFLESNSLGYYKVTTSVKVLHENFNYDMLDNDIGLLIIPAVPLSSNIQPILLPRRSDGDLGLPGKNAIVSGWGITGRGQPMSEDLLWSEVKMIDDVYCSLSYGESVYTSNTKLCVTTRNGTEGACNGDSGGPLAYMNVATGENLLVGLVSFGATAGCDSGFPEVFTRVSAYIDWIALHGGPAVRP